MQQLFSSTFEKLHFLGKLESGCHLCSSPTYAPPPALHPIWCRPTGGKWKPSGPKYNNRERKGFLAPLLPTPPSKATLVIRTRSERGLVKRGKSELASCQKHEKVCSSACLGKYFLKSHIAPTKDVRFQGAKPSHACFHAFFIIFNLLF